MFGFLFALSWLDYFIIICGLLVAVYYYLSKNFGFFDKRGIPYEKPYPVLGSMWRIIFKLENFYDFTQRVYLRSKKNDGISGSFDQSRPVIVVGSPEVFKTVTVKEFDHFTDHRSFDVGGIFEKNLFNLKGLRWKNMRNTLSPAFTSSKLRFMYELIDKCAQQIDTFLMKEMEKQKADGHKEILVEQEVKQFFTRFTNDAIATSAFGIEVDSLADPENEFYLMGKDLTDIFSGLRWIKLFLASFSPFLFKLIYDKSFFSKKALNYFTNVANENIAKRRKEKIVRPDMIHLLLEAQATKEDPGDFTDDDIVAQALLFFFAGFETVSATLAIAAHQLAEFPEVQEKLHQEIDQKLKENNGVIPYDVLMKGMPYLDNVLDETQRRLPAVPFVERICTKSYTFPSTDNRPEYTINPGEQVLIPGHGFHRDADYFPEPDKLIPERWNDETKHNVNVFLPFGIGPRMCIANRFARMEAKLALLYILKNCKLIFTEKTENPIKFASKGLAIQNEHGYWLGFKPRHNN